MSCCHRWVIQPPQPGNGELKGVCKLCGKEREFDAAPLPNGYRSYPIIIGREEYAVGEIEEWDA